MSEQDGRQVTTLQRPATNDLEAWIVYWEAQGQPWRTEPEIDTDRQVFLAERLVIKPDIMQGIYPFKDISLSRADVEWLLATHENGRGPVDWSDEYQRNRKGLDLRGALLSTADLSNLPLARSYGGLTVREWDGIPPEQRECAAVHLEGAKLRLAHLEGIDFSGAYLECANLRGAFMERAYLVGIHLEGARLDRAYLKNAYLREAHLEGSLLTRAYLNEANLSRAHLEGKEVLPPDLARVRKWDKTFRAVLPPAELKGSFFDIGTNLDNINFGDIKLGFVSLADVHWSDANLLTVDWTAIKTLGDEQKAKQPRDHTGKKKERQTQLEEYRTAVRANRQLSVVLRDQGLNEEADHFAYRAQQLQRVVLWHQRNFGRYLFLGFLDLLAGYGYRPGRSVFWYLATVCGFALAYHILGQLSIIPPDAFIYSLTSFHGRGFFPGLEHRTSLHGPLIMLAAIEAMVGLFIEISFIATFTQRFFGR